MIKWTTQYLRNASLLDVRCALRKLKRNIFKSQDNEIDSGSENNANIIIENMHGVIVEGSNRIKDLELKIKAKGKGNLFR